jgi:AhpD family alkylhydroperoxidase
LIADHPLNAPLMGIRPPGQFARLAELPLQPCAKTVVGGSAMTAIAAKPLKSYPWFIRLFFWKQRLTYGHVLDPSLLWGRSPWVFASVALLYGALDRRSSPLPPALRSLVTVRVSQINHCAFCVDINSATLAKRGVPDEKIDALSDWRRSSLFDSDDRLALEYAEAITLNRVDDDLRNRLKKQWSDDAIVELTGLVAFQNLSSKFNAALDVPAQGFCRVPGTTPASQ